MDQHRLRPSLRANRLWIARKRAGLPQKWAASLLGHHSVSKISEYEHGRKQPGLRTALKLALIYRTPIPDLLPRLQAELEQEVAGAEARHPYLKQRRTDCPWRINKCGESVTIP